MTPQLAAKLTIHDDAPPGRRHGCTSVVSLAGAAGASCASRARAADRCSAARRSHRRLLGAADVLAATVALDVVLASLGSEQPGIAVVAGMPLVVVLFKVAGLYDRDQMRLVPLDAGRGARCCCSSPASTRSCVTIAAVRC